METQQPTSSEAVNQQPVISPGMWALYAFISGIPLIGLIMLLVWAFGNDANKVRSNWAKGMLLLYVIVIVIYILIVVLFGAAIFAGMQNGGFNP